MNKQNIESNNINLFLFKLFPPFQQIKHDNFVKIYKLIIFIRSYTIKNEWIYLKIVSEFYIKK